MGTRAYQEYFPAEVQKLSQAFGATRSELAKYFEVSPGTIDKWCQDHSEFKDAMERLRAKSVARIESALFKKAEGYEREVEKAYCTKDGDIRKAKTKEYVAPDTSAAIFYLKNMAPDTWRDSHQTEITGGGGAMLPMINITLNTSKGEEAIRPAIDMTKARGGSLEYHAKKQTKVAMQRLEDHPPTVTINADPNYEQPKLTAGPPRTAAFEMAKPKKHEEITPEEEEFEEYDYDEE